MASLQRYRVTWTGITGSPGINTFYFKSPVDPAAALQAMYSSISGLLPSAAVISFPTLGEVINDSNGALTGTFTSAGAASVTGTAGANYSAASGAMIRWTTGVALNGRLVIGKTFLVPLGTTAYDAGSLTSAALTTIGNAASTFRGTGAGTVLTIWNRPRPATSGTHTDVTGSVVPDKAVVLRSRRD
jgi:hypothetical protein